MKRNNPARRDSKNKAAQRLQNLRWNKPEWKDPKKRKEWGAFLVSTRKKGAGQKSNEKIDKTGLIERQSNT